MSEHIKIEEINNLCCCFNTRKIARAVTQLFDRNLETVGIRSTQFTLLVALAATRAKTLTEIAESLIMDRTTLTRNLKPLEKMHLIETVQTADKRSKAYALTDKGRSVVQHAIPHWHNAQKAVLSLIGEEGYRQMKREAEKLLAVTAYGDNMR